MTTLVFPAMAQASHQGLRFKAFFSALGLEMLLFGAGLFWLATHPPQPALVVIPLTIEAIPAPPVSEKLTEPEITKPPPPTSQVAKPIAHLTPPAVLPPPPKAAISPAPAQNPVLEPSPKAAIAPTPAPAPTQNPVLEPSHVSPPTAVAAPLAAPQPVSPPAVDPSPAYNAKLAAAVQAVFEVPAAAAELNFRGRTRVEFNLRDGQVSMVRIVQTSGLGVADRAAVKAVQAAIYPSPPAQLQGKEATYQIWVACL
jgi:periplasmic protein TonB